MTCSIAAVDKVTGQLGVAVHTCMPAVGASVPWAEPGVGVVATQGFVDAAYGPRCLEGLRGGANATDALHAAQQLDPMAVLRQVAVISASGEAAVTTGAGCVDHAGHLVGEGFSVQANMAGSAEVWSAMADAFQTASGTLAWRLLAALQAGEAAGGDARGHMSAALLVVDCQRPEQPGAGIVADLRVDRASDPLTDLSNLLAASEGYQLFDAFVGQFFGGDPAASLATIDQALAVLPGEDNFVFGRAGALLATGEAAAAFHELHTLTNKRAGWAELFRGFVDKGLMVLPDGVSVDAALRPPTPTVTVS